MWRVPKAKRAKDRGGTQQIFKAGPSRQEKGLGKGALTTAGSPWPTFVRCAIGQATSAPAAPAPSAGLAARCWLGEHLRGASLCAHICIARMPVVALSAHLHASRCRAETMRCAGRLAVALLALFAASPLYFQCGLFVGVLLLPFHGGPFTVALLRLPFYGVHCHGRQAAVCRSVARQGASGGCCVGVLGCGSWLSHSSRCGLIRCASSAHVWVRPAWQSAGRGLTRCTARPQALLVRCGWARVTPARDFALFLLANFE